MKKLATRGSFISLVLIPLAPLALAWTVSGCGAPTVPTPDPLHDVIQVVPAGEAEEIPGRPVAARFWGEIDPVAGAVAFYEIHPGNVIYRDQAQSALKYDFGANVATQGACSPASGCLPAAGALRLWTDQSKVTYVSGSGHCSSNGATCVTPALPCGKAFAFCAPLQIVSNVTWGSPSGRGAMPDVIIQLSQPMNTVNRIAGCMDNPTNQFGLCKTTGGNKVDSTFSDLTSPIPGDGTNTFGCSYCYGNSAAVGSSMAGLRSALVSGLDATLRGYYTDKLALQLTNDSSFSLVMTVRYATPNFDKPGAQITLRNGGTLVACATAGTSTATFGGGGFGPPAQCLAATPPVACPTSGASAAPGYQILFPKTGGGTVAGVITAWSDTLIRAIVPANAVGGQVQFVTPQATNQTSDSLVVCAAANSWRSLSPALITSVGGMGAAFGTTIVVTGGRADPTLTTGALATTSLYALPATAAATGSVSTGGSLITARWGAASALLGGSLYVIGGVASDGNRCLSDSEALPAANGAWSQVQSAGAAVNLPVPLCQAAAVALGNYLIVSGGSTSPYQDATFDVAASNQGKVYVLDTTNLAAGWVTFSGGATIDPVDRFNQVGVSAGAVGLFVGGSDFIPSALGAVSKLTQAAGTPGFTMVASLPAALSLPGVASAGTSFYSFGGGTSSEGTSAAVTAMYQTSNATPGAWTTLAPSGSAPTRRWGHVFIAATPGYSASPRIYAIGGANDQGAVTAIEEYTP